MKTKKTAKKTVKKAAPAKAVPAKKVAPPVAAPKTVKKAKKKAKKRVAKKPASTLPKAQLFDLSTAPIAQPLPVRTSVGQAVTPASDIGRPRTVSEVCSGLNNGTNYIPVMSAFPPAPSKQVDTLPGTWTF